MPKKKKGSRQMISEDPRAMSNLPQDVMMKPYPEAPYMPGAEGYDDIQGIDQQMWEDSHGGSIRKGYSVKKY